MPTLGLIALTIFSFAPVPLHVEGSRLVEDGRDVILRGVVTPSLESSNTGEHVFRSCRVAVEDWKANCILLPVSQDRWLGKAEGQKNKGDEYRQLIDDVVNYVTRSDGYLVLDLAESDLGTLGKNLGQHTLPDQNSVTFWREAARKYRGNGRVLFELYDSPTGTDWLSETPGLAAENGISFKPASAPQLVKTIRAAGAKNVVVLAGGEIRDSGDWLGEKLQGSGFVMEARELSRISRRSTVPFFLRFMGGAHSEGFAPVMAQGISWIAEAMSPHGESALIADWAYKPTEFGARVREALQAPG